MFVRTDRNEPVDIGVDPDVWIWYGVFQGHDYPLHVIQAARGEYYVNVFWDDRSSPCDCHDKRAAAIDLLAQYVKDWK